MARLPFLCVCVLAAGLGGCVAHTRVENAALTQPWPTAPAADLTAHAKPAGDYPTVSGDVLKGTSPADQAAARAEVTRALDAVTSSGPQ